MYDELVKRLRKLSGTDNLSEFDEAAEAIEELQKRVPKVPHGRLIDAKRLLDAMFRLVDEETFRAFCQVVNDAPTIIPAEEGE